MDPTKMVDELERDEAFRPKPYFDCGHSSFLTCPVCSDGILTVGIGRNLRDVGVHRDEAYKMCHNDIEEATVLLDTYCPWWSRLSENRQRVLTNMCFNMGMKPHGTPGKRGLWDFQATLKLIQDGKYQEAATHMLGTAWAKQVGPRAIRLSQMMEQGG